MKYDIKAHPTEYRGVMFRSRLEARWAAFFDLIEWRWEYEPIDLNGWTPDFRVEFDCCHSECGGGHTLLVEIKPYYFIEQFSGHPCTKYYFGGIGYGYERLIQEDSSAAFGNNPHVTYWEMVHGAGGGVESVEQRTQGIDIDALWNKAGEITQWHPK